MDMRETLRGAKEKVAATLGSTVERNSDRIQTGIDKAAGFVDERTKGRYHDRIGSVTGLAKDRLGLPGGVGRPPAGQSPPPAPPAPSAEPTDPYSAGPTS